MSLESYFLCLELLRQESWGAGEIAQLIGCLLSMGKVLGFIPISEKKEGRKGRRKGGRGGRERQRKRGREGVKERKEDADHTVP